jgi:hypothetical protein
MDQHNLDNPGEHTTLISLNETITAGHWHPFDGTLPSLGFL